MPRAAEVVAAEPEIVNGFPVKISTSYVERQNLTLRTMQKRFARHTNAFSKKLANHAGAAVGAEPASAGVLAYFHPQCPKLSFAVS